MKHLVCLCIPLLFGAAAAAQDGIGNHWKSDSAAISREAAASIFGDSIPLASGFHAGIGTGNSLGVIFSAGYQTSGGWIVFMQMVTGAAWSRNLRTKWGVGLNYTVPFRDADIRPYFEAATGSDLHSPDPDAGMPADLYSYVSAGCRWDLGKKWSVFAGVMYSHTGINWEDWYPVRKIRRVDERRVGFQIRVAVSGI